MAFNTKNWNTRLTEIKTTINGTTSHYKTGLIIRINQKLALMTDAAKTTLSNSFHLSKQKTKQDRDYYRAIALIEHLFMPNPRSLATIVAHHSADATYLVLSSLNRLIKSLDPASPNPPDLANHRPLAIGVSISGGNHAGPGSIACFVKCNKNGKMMILGNQHVMLAEFGTGTENPPDILQRSKGNGGKQTDVVATWDRGILDARIDAAVAYLADDVNWENRTPEGETALGFCTNFKKDDDVWKRGCASRRTEGRIEDPKHNATVPHAKFGGNINFANQIEAKVTGLKTEFQIPGDSGSALFNVNNQIIGVMHGGGMDGGGIATPITVVCNLLDISFP